MTEPFFLKSGRLALARCVPDPEELEQLTTWANDGAVTHYMFTGLMPMSEDNVLPLHRWGSDQHVFACYTDRFIGTAGLYAIGWTHRVAEFRIFLGESWGCGYGKLATQLVLTYAFERLGLHCVFLGVNEEHERAFRLYKGAGFVQEGILREQFFRNGRYYNLVRMSMLEDEYRKARLTWNLGQG